MFSVVVQDHFTNWEQWQLQTEKNENDMDEQKLLLLVIKKHGGLILFVCVCSQVREGAMSDLQTQLREVLRENELLRRDVRTLRLVHPRL